MSKHPHEPDHSQPAGRPRPVPATGDAGDTLPNRTANTSLTNPGPPPGGTSHQGASGGAGDTLPNRTANTSLTDPGSPSGGASGALPNRTANTSLTDPGPPPGNAVPGQFGEVGQTAQGTDLTAQMESAGPSSGNVPGGDDLIPWDPTGKIDDEVERRYRKPPGQQQPAPQQGGVSPVPAGDAGLGGADAGPARYGGATDEAPTSEEAGAITTLAANAAPGGARTMQDVRPPSVPPQGSRDAGRQADGGAGEPPAPARGKEANPARPARRPDPGGYGEVQ